MNKPVISIIIPVYNSAATIRKCVDSVKAQTFSDWELIIADNGSSDGSSSICSQLAVEDARIRAIEVVHRGVSAARNAAIEIACGKYICFADSDDVLDPNYLQHLISYKDFDLVVCGYFVDTLTKDKKELKRNICNPKTLVWTSEDDKIALQNLFEMGFMHFCWNKLFRRSIIERNNIRFKHIPVNEDYLFVVEYIKYITSINVIDKPLYHWSRVEEVITGVKSIPDNILDIYNESHLATRQFFGKESVADRIAYYSYELIIYKYYEAIRMGRISKIDAFNKIDELIHNSLVRDAYKAYNPKSKGETLLYTLMKMGLYKVHYFLSQKIL